MTKTAIVRPDCGMQMIVVKGARLEPQHKTYECLWCGHVAILNTHETEKGS